MNTALTVIAIICVFVLPVPIVWLTRRNKILGAIGAIACCYIVGFVFSTIGLSGVTYDKSLTTTVAYVLVALSIPLILFSIDLRQVRYLTRGMLVGFGLCIVSVVGVAVGAYFLVDRFYPCLDLSAMIVGLYTGGTPNMNAIGAAMEAGSSVISAANVADTLVGGIYFVILVSVAPKIYSFLLARKSRKKAAAPGSAAGNPTDTSSENPSDTADTSTATADTSADTSGDISADTSAAEEGTESIREVAAVAEEEADEQSRGGKGLKKVKIAADEAGDKKRDDFTFGISIKDKKSILRLVLAFLLAVGCLGVGALPELIFEGTVGSNLLYILLSVSVLGVVFSFVGPVRRIKGQYPLGMYLILMFSLALSMSIDWTVFLTDILPTLAFFACAQVSTIIVHLILCRLARVDGPTALITSTAGIYGPPFIAPVAKSAGSRELIAPGVICGALGLAIGTPLGVLVGRLLLLVAA